MTLFNAFKVGIIFNSWLLVVSVVFMLPYAFMMLIFPNYLESAWIIITIFISLVLTMTFVLYSLEWLEDKMFV